MANNPFFSDAVVESAVNSALAAANAGFVNIYTGSQPGDANQTPTGTLLAKLPMSATAFQASTASGSTGSRIVTAVANAISSAAALVSGTAGYFAILKSDGITVVAMGSVGTSGADCNLNSTSLTGGQLVSISSLQVTQSEA